MTKVTLTMKQAQRRTLKGKAFGERLKHVDFDPSEGGNWCRAGSDSICVCGLPYGMHPEHPACEWLTVICGGRLVKL